MVADAQVGHKMADRDMAVAQVGEIRGLHRGLHRT
jgi:hypothetical protein